MNLKKRKLDDVLSYLNAKKFAYSNIYSYSITSNINININSDIN